MELHFWSPHVGKWIKLRPKRTGEAGVVELTPEDLASARVLQISGVDDRVALERVVGKI